MLLSDHRYMRLTALLLLVVLFLGTFSGCGGKAASFYGEGTHWTGGYGECAMTPEDPASTLYYVAGYRNDHPATGILDTPMTKAIWLDDNSGRGGVILAAIDCVGLSGTDIDEIRDSLSTFIRESGCRAVHIASTHTHAGIDTLGLWGPIAVSGKNSEYMKTVKEAAANAIRSAYDSRCDGTLSYGSASLPGIQRDSRDPQVYSDTLDVLHFTGKRSFRLLRFDAHPEALGGDNTLISADYPAYAARYLKEQTGEDTIFFAGAVGGLISIASRTDESGSELDRLTLTRETGILLGQAAMDADETELPPTLNERTESVDLTLENSLFAVYSFLGIINHHSVYGGGTLNTALQSMLSYLEIGDIPFVLLPGEVFPELVYGGYLTDSPDNPTPLSAIAGCERLLVVGLCDDEIGYIIPPDDFVLSDTLPYVEDGQSEDGRKHYEETNSISPYAALELSDAFAAMMNQIRQEK